MENDSSDSDANVVVITSVTPSPSTSSSSRKNVTPARRIPANKNERAPCWEIFNIKEGEGVTYCVLGEPTNLGTRPFYFFRSSFLLYL